MGLHPLAVLLRCSAKAEALPQSCCGCALLLGWHCTVPSQDAQSTANCLQLQSTKTIVHPPRDPIKIPVKAAVTQTTGSAVELSQGSCSTIGNPKPPPNPYMEPLCCTRSTAKWFGGSKAGATLQPCLWGWKWGCWLWAALRKRDKTCSVGRAQPRCAGGQDVAFCFL